MDGIRKKKDIFKTLCNFSHSGRSRLVGPKICHSQHQAPPLLLPKVGRAEPSGGESGEPHRFFTPFLKWHIWLRFDWTPEVLQVVATVMKRKTVTAIFLLVVLYLVIGAAVFRSLEQPHERYRDSFICPFLCRFYLNVENLRSSFDNYVGLTLQDKRWTQFNPWKIVQIQTTNYL